MLYTTCAIFNAGVETYVEQVMRITTDTAVVYNTHSCIYLDCHDRVRPADDSTDEGSLSRPLRSEQSSSLQAVTAFRWLRGDLCLEVKVKHLCSMILKNPDSILPRKAGRV